MKLLSTPFTFKGKSFLGNIYRPYVRILVTSKRIDEWIPVEMVVDTGADYTLLPKRYAQLLGIDLIKECRLDKTLGVGGQEKIFLYKKGIQIKIAKLEKEIPVGFLNRNDIPSLLGRLECLEILTLVMEDRVTTLEV